MIFKRMREQILDKAIRGLIVPQLQEEGVVEQIGDAPTEVPFEIPSSWRWVKLGNLISVIAGTSYKKSDITSSNQDVRIIRGGNLKNFKISLLDDDVFVSQSLADSSKEIQHDDIVIVASTGSKDVIGRAAIYAGSNKAQIGAFLRIIRPKNTEYADYLKLIFRSSFYSMHIRSSVKGTNINNIKKEYITDFYIPVPPLAEQKRIAAKIESLFGEIERAEKAYEELQSLANVLRGQILQKAIQGKLVPQLPEDGVVEQIGHAPEEMPFELPASWKWASLNSIGTIVSGATPKTSVAEFWNGDINWVTPADLGKSSSKWISHGSRFLTKAGLKSCSAVLMPKGSIVYSSRAPIGHIAIAANELCTNQGCKSFVPKEEYILTEWAYYTLIARTKDIQSRASGTTFKEISGTGMGNTLIPLPPLAEQKRIVSKVEALFEQIDLMTK